MLGFPLTSSRLASSQVGVILELEIWSMRVGFLSASKVRVSLDSFLLGSLTNSMAVSMFRLGRRVLLRNTLALHLSTDDADRSWLQLLPNKSVFLSTN